MQKRIRSVKERSTHWAPSIKLESIESCALNRFMGNHGRSIKLENQVESIQREWIDSTVRLWISSESSSCMISRARKSFSKASPYFFVQTGPVYDGDNLLVCRSIISHDFRSSAERDSLDGSSAFLKGAHYLRGANSASITSLAIQLRSFSQKKVYWMDLLVHSVHFLLRKRT